MHKRSWAENMKPKLSISIFLLLYIFLLVACSGSDGGDDNFDDDSLGVPGRPQGYLVPELVSLALPFNTLESSGWHTCGVVNDGTTYCWGDNEYGALGSNVVSCR